MDWELVCYSFAAENWGGIVWFDIEKPHGEVCVSDIPHNCLICFMLWDEVAPAIVSSQ